MVSNPAGQSALLQILHKVDEQIVPELPPQGPGRLNTYPEALFLKALLLMTVLRLNKIYELLTTLEQNTPTMHALRAHLCHEDKLPNRRTFERRCARLTLRLPHLIARLAERILGCLDLFSQQGRAAALDSTVLRAKDGAVWHKKHKDAGLVPHSRIDTQAGWTKSGWHGWVYGWKLHLACTLGPIWLPLAARLTPADVHDSHIGQALVADLSGDIGLVLGDTHFYTEEMRAACHLRGIELVATRPPALRRATQEDPGKEVRRFFHPLRSKAIENFNEHFKAIFDSHADVPTRGQQATTRFALSAVLIYQLGIWLRHEAGLPPCQGLKPFLRAI